jgi:hypothetical protein
LAAEESIEVVLSQDILHRHGVDLVVAHEEARVLTILIDVVDVLTCGPDLGLFHENMVYGLRQGGGQLEKFFSFLRQADDFLGLAPEDLTKDGKG